MRVANNLFGHFFPQTLDQSETWSKPSKISQGACVFEKTLCELKIYHKKR